MTAAIDVQNLSYSYGNRPVLKDLSFSIQKGLFFIVIGPNGSWKTTLMKAISGIEMPKKGNVKILGLPLQRYTRKALAQSIAFVPQTAPMDFPFTVTEVILMGRAPHQGILGLKQDKDLTVAKQAMVFTGVEHLADRKLNQLSGGERQRVFIARAICQEPQIILLDEPTASLDLAHQIRIMDLMEQLKSENGITVVMVSHDVNLAAMYGERLILMKEGRIVKLGTPDEVLTYPILEDVYDCTLLVDKSPFGIYPRITLVPQKLLKIHKRSQELP